MAEDTNSSPFRCTHVEQFQFQVFSYERRKKSELKVKGGVYRAAFLEHDDSTDERNKIVITPSKYYLSLHTLRERLENPSVRNDDIEALKTNREATPFDIWDTLGLPANIPSNLIFYKARGRYDEKLDARQLDEWVKIAKGLGGRSTNTGDPIYSRFLLRLPASLKDKEDLVYCSPAETPSFGVDEEKLAAIIAANKGKFDGWPDPVVVDFKTADEDPSLRLVGRNFFQFYFTWMKADLYKELWASAPYRVTELLHTLPAGNQEADYRDVDGSLKQPTTGTNASAASTFIVIRSSKHRGPTERVMGKSATKVAERLWGQNHITSGMGGERSNGELATVEWLHRTAYSLGGADTFKNLIFGTWECNTDMCRAENFIRMLADKCTGESKGLLTTTNKSPGTFYRPNALASATDATIPTWASEYSWLSFSLEYQYQMGADNPLGEAFVQTIVFDPWSLYTPLSMEPRLDTYILQNLTSGRSSVDVVSKIVPEVPHNASRAVDRTANPQPPPNAPVPACHVAIHGLPSANLLDIAVNYPTVVSRPVPDKATTVLRPLRSRRSTSVISPVSVVQRLFGTAVSGNLQRWTDPMSRSVTGIDPPCIERVVIEKDVHLSQLIPLLDGTPFDTIVFRNVAIFHQNYAFDKTKSVGWHFNADWVIDPSCGLLHDILRTALRVNEPTLSIHAAFGKSLRWSTPLKLQSFILEGVFSNLRLPPFSGLTLTTVGVRLLGIRGFAYTPQPHSTLSFGFAVFGVMKLKVPGSVMPLDLEYELGLVGNTVNLHAEISGSIWEDALGVDGLLLEDVVFGTSFCATSLWNTFSFDVSATFSYLSSVAYLQGSYGAGGHFSLTAELDDFGINELNDLFHTLIGDFLTLPDFDVHVGSAIVSIVSGQGLSISLLDVDIAGYTAVSVEVTLSSSGASLSGQLSSNDIAFGDVELRDAVIKLAFWTTDKKKKVDLLLGGTVKLDLLEVEAAVHLYPGRGGVEWAVVAELSTPGQPIAISDIVPAVKGSNVDFSLSDAVVIAASQDDSLISQSFPDYPVRKGVHVFGRIESIEALDKLLRQEIKDLVFKAGWSQDSGFDLSVALPPGTSIDLGNGIKTTPITLGIRTHPSVELAIAAGLRVPVQKSTPLTFRFVLAANLTCATASAQMQGWWVKPFGIEKLKIGPEVTLSIEIIYATFLSTGLPSGFAVSGGLMMGGTSAFLAMDVSENPQRQLLFGKVEALDLSDVVAFARTLVHEDIPEMPEKLLKFENLEIYVCPFGVVLGETAYRQGFSFKADLLLFEKRVDITCRLSKATKSVDIVGGIDNFELGPLVVSGAEGPRATLKCHVGISKQQLVVDGVVCIFDVRAQTYIHLEFLPKPTFKFYVMLKWADVFMLKLDAALLGSISDRLSDADFAFSAELDDHILMYIAQQILEKFEAANVVATHGLEVAQKKVDEAEAQWAGAIADAQETLVDAQRTWRSYETRVRRSSQPVIDNYLAEISRLEGEIDKARVDYENAMDDARRAVMQANQDRAAALASAQRDVERARQDMHSDIDDAQRTLDDAKVTLSSAFGNAQRDIEHAQRNVDGIQCEIEDTKRTIGEYEMASNWEFWKKAAIPGLWTWVGTLEASMAAATVALDVASAVLEGTGYVTKEGAVEAARRALDAARSTGYLGLVTAQGVLHLADETSDAAVGAAEATLDGVKQGGKYVAFESAKGALEGFREANEAGYEAAVAEMEGLMDSTGFIAFNAAKAGLEVAKGSTKVLDAAREALALAEKASQGALSVLKAVVQWAEQAVNITMINLSGTLRGVLGVGGGTARPLRAAIQGCVVGQWFEIEAEFDPTQPVKFITAIFKQLWDSVSALGRVRAPMVVPAEPYHHIAGREAFMIQGIQPRPFLAAQSVQFQAVQGTFLQERLEVFEMRDPAPILTDIPRGPFSGRPIVSSAAVARHALIVMHEARGISLFKDCEERFEDCEDESCPYVHWRK